MRKDERHIGDVADAVPQISPLSKWHWGQPLFVIFGLVCKDSVMLVR